MRFENKRQRNKYGKLKSLRKNKYHHVGPFRSKRRATKPSAWSATGSKALPCTDLQYLKNLRIVSDGQFLVPHCAGFVVISVALLENCRRLHLVLGGDEPTNFDRGLNLERKRAALTAEIRQGKQKQIS